MDENDTFNLKYAIVGTYTVRGLQQNAAYDPLHTSYQRSSADYLRSNNVKITFCGFRNKNETYSEGYVLHPIKTHLCQEKIFIDINHFDQNFIPFTL